MGETDAANPKPEGYVWPKGRSGPCRRQQPRDWVDEWILAKPELIPAHLGWIFTLALAIFALAAWRDSKTTTDTLAQQARTAQHQLQLLREQQRPWIYMDQLTDPLSVDFHNTGMASGHDHLTVTVSLKIIVGNSGKTPAHLVHLAGNLVFRTSSIRREEYRQKGRLAIESQDCKAAKVQTDRITGITVFPDQPAVLRGDFDMLPDEINHWTEKPDEAFHDLILTGCIDYVFYEEKPRHHQTDFAFLVLMQKDDPKTNQKKKPIPAPQGRFPPIAALELHGLQLDTIDDAALDAD